MIHSIKYFVKMGQTKSVFRVWPGKNPLRLYLTVSVIDRKTGRWFMRFQYDGAWNLGPIRKAIRVYNSMVGVQRNSCMIEYTPSHKVYEGSLTHGRILKYRHLVHLDGTVAVKSGMIEKGHHPFVFPKNPPVFLRLSKNIYVLWSGPLPYKNDTASWLAIKKYCWAMRKRVLAV